ncbi:MAG TPA: hypothetical protein VF781_14895 [Solirubrobacteraceae bacterium]
MTPFFIPVDQGQTGEDVYQELRRQTEREMGRPPTRRRILELWTRRGKLDCHTRVGAPDPIWGETVTAIFDMGSHQPFVVFRQHPVHPGQHSCEVLGCNAYSVLDFSP